MIRSLSAPLALFAISLATACVPADAGYQDVRRTTSVRIHQDVRWYEHDSPAASAKQTRELLARPLNADAAVQVALLNNQGLQAAFEDLGVARGRLVDGLRLPNPSLDAALRFKRSTRPDIDLAAMEDLSELLFLPLRNGVAGAHLDAAKASVAGTVLDLALEVRIAFYEYQAAAQNLELRRSVLEAVRAAAETAEKLHTAGNITDLSFASERALYEESRVALASAETMLQAKREGLNARLGLWGHNASWSTEPRLLDAVPLTRALDQTESRALERSLDLEVLRHRFEAAAKGANLSRLRGFLPELKAGVSAERGDSDWGVGPAASLELPLFYQGQGETAVALAEMRRARSLYGDTAIRIRAAARTAVARLRATADSADYYKRVLLPLREQIVRDSQLEYNAMGLGVFQLLQAKRDQIEAARTYVELLQAYWTAHAEVEQLLAGRLPRAMAALDDVTGEAPPAAGRGAAQH